jgi:hypothetical protein
MYGSMHSDVAGALVANAIDPMRSIVFGSMKQSMRATDVETDKEVLKLMDALVEKINTLQKASADPKVVAAYQRMLDKHSA